MSDLRDLYQEVILDHAKHPHNFGKLPTASHHAQGYNPVCGDKVSLYLELDENKIKQLSFEGSGCAISTASVSMLTEALKGKTVDEVNILFNEFHRLVTGNGLLKNQKNHLGKLEIFEGVGEFPTRVKCATLCWHTLKAALGHKNEAVTTEE